MISSHITARPLVARDIHVYRVCEILSESLIFAMIVFAPWALGTTQPWAIWTMNATGFALGCLLLIKLAIRYLKDYKPARWTESRRNRGVEATPDPRRHGGGYIIRGLVILTFIILGYCLLSATNARQAYNQTAGFFEDLDRPAWLTIWLPSSLDRSRSWLAFWNYLALACAFWAIHDWLLGKTDAEQGAVEPGKSLTRASSPQPSPPEEERETAPRLAAERRANSGARGRSAADSNAGSHAVAASYLPERLRRLLWVLALNGGLVALESIVQRLSGSSKLLFLVQPRVNPLGETQFGPYAYRSNAAQYLNLIWPVILGFWWMLRRGRSSENRRGHALLPCCVLMAGGSMMSTSRGGALVAAGLLVAGLIALTAVTFLFPRHREEKRASRQALRWVAICALAALAIGVGFGWKSLKPRIAALGEGFIDREMRYDAARPMARDYALFGTGPGSFERVFQLYRIETSTYWPAQLHNDWLETRITFGWVGMSLVLLAFALVLLRWFTPGGIHGGRRFMILMWLALAGCLMHARYDFPLQIYSVLFTFLVLCSCMSVLSRR